MLEYLFLKLKGIPVIVYLIDGLQRCPPISCIQALQRPVNRPQIILGRLLGEEHIIVPIEPHQPVLLLLEGLHGPLPQIADAAGLPPGSFLIPALQTGSVPLVSLLQAFAQAAGSLLGPFYLLKKLLEPLLCPDADCQLPVHAGRKRFKHPLKIKGRRCQVVQGYGQAAVELVMKAVHLRIIKGLAVKLRVVMGLHKFPAAELIDQGGNSPNRHRKIIRPGLYGAEHLHPLGVDLRIKGFMAAAEFPDKALHICRVLIGAAHPVPPPVGIGRKLKIQIRHHPASPLRPGGEHLLVSPCGPVVLGIRDSPLLRRQGAEHQCLPGPVANGNECPRDSQHHGHRCIVILKPVKIRIIVGGQENHGVLLPARYASQDIPGLLVPLHPRSRVE